MRGKASGTNRLTVDQYMNYFSELLSAKDKVFLENPLWSYNEFMIRANLERLADSNGIFDLTYFYALGVLFLNLSFPQKMRAVFGTIDENGDGCITRDEATKFFTIVLTGSLNIIKNIPEHINNMPQNSAKYSIAPENIEKIKNAMPEFEKIFNPSKISRLVEGLFTADTNKDGLVSYDEWEEWIQTSSYREQWGTISLLFDGI